MGRGASRSQFGGRSLEGTSVRKESVSNAKSRAGAQCDEFELIHGQLQSLEEDTRLMKEAVVGFVEERAALMAEITEQLHVMKGHSINLECGDSSLGPHSHVHCHKEGTKMIGLLEVLFHDSAPPLITRDIKVKLDALVTL